MSTIIMTNSLRSLKRYFAAIVKSLKLRIISALDADAIIKDLQKDIKVYKDKAEYYQEERDKVLVELDKWITKYLDTDWRPSLK